MGVAEVAAATRASRQSPLIENGVSCLHALFLYTPKFSNGMGRVSDRSNYNARAAGRYIVCSRSAAVDDGVSAWVVS